MRGDADGDGLFTENDSALILQIFIGEVTVSGEDRLAADTNGDGDVNNKDSLGAKQVAQGAVQPGEWGNDVTETWFQNPNYQSETSQFYTDIPINGITSDCCAVVIAEDPGNGIIFSKVECFENKIRIYATLCPKMDTTATVIWSQQNDNIITASSIIQNVSMAILESIIQTKVMSKTYLIVLKQADWISNYDGTYSMTIPVSGIRAYDKSSGRIDDIITVVDINGKYTNQKIEMTIKDNAVTFDIPAESTSTCGIFLQITPLLMQVDMQALN